MSYLQDLNHSLNQRVPDPYLHLVEQAKEHLIILLMLTTFCITLSAYQGQIISFMITSGIWAALTTTVTLHKKRKKLFVLATHQKKQHRKIQIYLIITCIILLCSALTNLNLMISGILTGLSMILTLMIVPTTLNLLVKIQEKNPESHKKEKTDT